LPPYEVLDLAARLPDSQFESDEEIVALKNQLVAARARWHAEIKAFDAIRFKVEAVPREVAALQAEIAAINATRPAVIAAAMLGDGTFNADDDLINRRDALALRAERIALAGPALEHQQKAANKRVEEACGPVTNLEDRCRRLADQKEWRAACD
jgi:hypothetical protein